MDAPLNHEGEWTSRFNKGDFVQWDSVYSYLVSSEIDQIDQHDFYLSCPWIGCVVCKLWVPNPEGWVYRVQRTYPDGTPYPDHHRYLLDEDVLEWIAAPIAAQPEHYTLDGEILPIPGDAVPFDLSRPTPAWLIALLPTIFLDHHG